VFCGLLRAVILLLFIQESTGNFLLIRRRSYEVYVKQVVELMEEKSMKRAIRKGIEDGEILGRILV
jgi:hypothetical protein